MFAINYYQINQLTCILASKIAAINQPLHWIHPLLVNKFQKPSKSSQVITYCSMAFSKIGSLFS